MTENKEKEIAGEVHTANFPQRKNWLTVEQTFVLNEACRAVNDAFDDVSFGVYQVGSSLFRPNYRDVDVRCIVEPDKWEGLFGTEKHVSTKSEPTQNFRPAQMDHIVATLWGTAISNNNIGMKATVESSQGRFNKRYGRVVVHVCQGVSGTESNRSETAEEGEAYDGCTEGRRQSGA